MSDLRSAVVARTAAEAEVSRRISYLLSFERTGANCARVHEALRGLVEALQGAQEATRRLALVLALDADQLAAGGDLDDIVPPVIEHEDA